MNKGFFTFPILIAVFLIVILSFAKYNNKQIITSKVIDKERITTTNGDQVESYYLIFTEAGPLKLEDDIIYGNFNSSDWYGQLRKDSTYTFHTIGFRIGYMSEYPTIIKFEK
jgi:hypothetical protein